MNSRLIYGIHPVEELLRKDARKIEELIFCLPIEKSKSVPAKTRLHVVAEIAKQKGVKTRSASKEELSALCGDDSHQGVVAVAGVYQYLDLHDLLMACECSSKGDGKVPLLLVVDGITDPQNLGAMFRSALLFGATGVVLPKDRCAGVTSTVVRVSSGATEHLPCAQVTNLVRALGEMKEAGFWIAGAVEKGGIAPAKADLCVPLSLVLGNEQKGIRPLVHRNCDLLLTIPVGGVIVSLNVASATAVLFYEVARQRSIRDQKE
ncbi:MAG: 23S rRNA (guanosine(2251)-2'-O)-methyltransferase RlmB [Pseudomonadota bacterium]